MLLRYIKFDSSVLSSPYGVSGLPGADDNSDVASLDVRCYMEDVPILHKPDKHSQYLLVWQDRGTGDRHLSHGGGEGLFCSLR